MTITFAEVMDKEPAAIWLLGWGIGLGLVAWLAIRWNRWLSILFAPLAILALLGLTSEIRDSYVGPAILHEAGYSYVASGWLAGVLPLIGCLAGWFSNVKRKGGENKSGASGKTRTGHITSLTEGPKRDVEVRISSKELFSEISDPPGAIQTTDVTGYEIVAEGDPNTYSFRLYVRLVTGSRVLFYGGVTQIDRALLLDEFEAALPNLPRTRIKA